LARQPALDEWMTTWVRGRELELRPWTLAGHRSDLRHISASIGHVRIDQLVAEDIEQLWRYMRDSGLSGGTVAHARRTLSAALATAVKRGRIPRNPVAAASTPRYTPAEVVPFAFAEVQAILAAAATKDCHLARWTLALGFGLRQGEALGLQWHDVDFEAGTLAIRRSLCVRTWQHGCGNTCGRNRGADCPSRHSGGLVAAETKTSSAVRTLSLPPPLLNQLCAGRAVQAAERLAAGELWQPGPGGGWVFASSLGRPLHPAADWRAWKELLSSAGVRDARLHDARHSAATSMLVLGLDARTVMGLLGWSQLSLTQRYQHLVPELRQEAARRIGEHLWGPS
jgi:integrase